LAVVADALAGLEDLKGKLEQGLWLGMEAGLRAAALPGVLGLRWAGRALAPQRDDTPSAERSASLAFKVALDEFFFATEAASSVLAMGRTEWARARRELDEACALFDRRGWLADPASYHRTPPAARVSERSARMAHVAFSHLSFESGYAPLPDEPGAARWLQQEGNHTAHAWVLRHPGPQRPWVVCVPGYRMGRPSVDFAGFRAQWLHHTLGLNVAIFVMPFHGPRTCGRRGGDGYLSGDFLDTIHAQAQAVWDLRSLLAWLRHQGAPAIGVHGVSLGGYTAALLSALEPGIERVVLGIPAACFLDLARAHVPPALLRAAEWLGFPTSEIGQALRVVSPLAMPPQIGHARRYIYAGVADRLAPPHHALDLWHHWDRPRVVWYQGSHVSFLLEPSVQALLAEALDATTLLDDAHADARAKVAPFPVADPSAAEIAARMQPAVAAQA
jgi:hypothetical protein